MRTLLITLAASLASAALVAAVLIPKLPDGKLSLNLPSSAFEPSPVPAVNCQAMLQKAWLAPHLALEVEDRSEQSISAFVRRQSTAPEQGLQLFGVYGGTPRIVLGAGEQPGNLLLTSYEHSIWTLELDGSADIQRIFITDSVAEVRLQRRSDLSWGGKLKRALGLVKPLSEIQLIRLNRDRACTFYGYDWQKDDKAQFRQLLASAEQLTGLQVQSFQGSYSPTPSSPPFTTPLAVPQQATTQPALAVEKPATAAVTTAQVHSLQDLRETIRQLIASGVLPAKLASMDMASGGQLLQLQEIDLGTPPLVQPDSLGNLACPSHGDSGLQGDDGPNIAECGFGNTQFYGGGDKDLLDDAWGNDLIYGGSGDDSLDAGWGSDILLFERGWGQDSIDKTCHNSRFDAALTPGAAELDYRWGYNNFIVFGPGITPADLHWEGQRLLHKSGDSLTFSGGNICFAFVFADDPLANLPQP